MGQRALRRRSASRPSTFIGTRGRELGGTRAERGSTYSTTQICYDETGQITAVIDPNGNTTQFDYTDKFYSDSSPAQNPPSSFTAPMPTHAFPTTVTLPIIGAQTVGYYYGSGKPAFTVDQNGADTYFHYLDPLDRPSHTFLPKTNGNRGWTMTLYDYVANSPGNVNFFATDTYSAINDTTASSSCTSCVHTAQNLDSLGRVTQNTFVSDPDGPTYTVTSYDISGRAHTVTNPYRTTNDSTYGVTTMAYDGLGRPTPVKLLGSNVHV